MTPQAIRQTSAEFAATYQAVHGAFTPDAFDVVTQLVAWLVTVAQVQEQEEEFLDAVPSGMPYQQDYNDAQP